MSKALELMGLLDLLGSSAAPEVGPTPLGALLKPEDACRRRSLSCPEYDGCLDVACREGWRSWTCEHCSRFGLAGDYEAVAAKHAAAARDEPALYHAWAK